MTNRKAKTMKKLTLQFAVVVTLAVASSCTTLVQMERTSPPEALLPGDSNRFLFVNFYDYMIPDYIGFAEKIQLNNIATWYFCSVC